MPSSATSEDFAIFPVSANFENSSFEGANFAGSCRLPFASANAAATSFSSSACGISRAESERNTFIFAPENSRFKSSTASFAENPSRAAFAISRSSSGDVKTAPSENAETISFARSRLLRVVLALIALSSWRKSFFFAASSSASEMLGTPSSCLKFSASARARSVTGDSALNIRVRQKREKSNEPAEPFVTPEPGVSATLRYLAFTA